MVFIANFFGGYLGNFNFNMRGNWEILDEHNGTWEENDHTLTYFIQLDPIEFNLDDGTQLRQGNIFHEYLKETRRIIREGNRFRIREPEEIIDTHWSKFWIADIGYIIVNKPYSQKKAFETISQAMTGEIGNIEKINFNMDAVFHNYHTSQWVGGFQDREGNIQRGSFWGENIAEDDEMGEAYRRTRHKNQVGFITDYFEAGVKVKLTTAGYIQIWTDLSENPDSVFEFIRDDLAQYIL